jgi:[ribosomal protein S5]-alanine N-acetyltransferase
MSKENGMESKHPLVIPTTLSGLVLREFTSGDAFPLFSLIRENCDHLVDWGNEDPKKYKNIGTVERALCRAAISPKITLGIWHERRLAGGITLIPSVPGEIEIGYWLGKEHCGKGLATLAVQALASYAFYRMQKDRIFAITKRRNGRSRKVLERNNFTVASIDGEMIRFIREKEAAIGPL